MRSLVMKTDLNALENQIAGGYLLIVMFAQNVRRTFRATTDKNKYIKHHIPKTHDFTTLFSNYYVFILTVLYFY